jgi:hypothetical protein
LQHQITLFVTNGKALLAVTSTLDLQAPPSVHRAESTDNSAFSYTKCMLLRLWYWSDSKPIIQDFTSTCLKHLCINSSWHDSAPVRLVQIGTSLLLNASKWSTSRECRTPFVPYDTAPVRPVKIEANLFLNASKWLTN